MEVKIVDALPGAGKTSAAINYINSTPDDIRILYITPFLDEVQRIINSCPEKKFKQPEMHGSKLNDIKQLFNKGYNIVSTHALFLKFDQEIIDIARSYGYVLIMDEVADVVQELDITKDDLDTLLEKYVEIVDGHMLHWTAETYKGEFEKYKKLCELNMVAIYGDCVLLWLFPVEAFKAFDDIYILTYMFDAQLQRYYYDYHNVEYKYIYVAGDSLDTYHFTDEEVIYSIPDYKSLIHIIDDDKLNRIGFADNSLSKTWYFRNRNNECMKQIKNNLNTFFRRRMNTPSKANLWTTFSDYKNKLSGAGYSRGFLACNARAVNTYRECYAVAYLLNRFFSPVLKNFFTQNGVRVEEDAYALSELIQWIFRSAIRDGKEIWLYIPSKRMRNLLIDWIGVDKPEDLKLGKKMIEN